MTIYTKKGDGGDTSLINENGIPKSDQIFEVLGTLDELNASLGFIHKSRIPEIKKTVIKIQNELFSLGAMLANQEQSVNKDYLEEKTTEMERFIDEYDQKMPELTSFILPGGTEVSARLHLSRAISRRLERSYVRYVDQTRSSNDVKYVLKYMNRLSDLLFVLARYANNKTGVKDQIWEK